MNHADRYCVTLENVTREELVNALHQSLMQFNAMEQGLENVDNKPAQAEITRIMIKAGHVGFSTNPGVSSERSESAAREVQQPTKEKE